MKTNILAAAALAAVLAAPAFAGTTSETKSMVKPELSSSVITPTAPDTSASDDADITSGAGAAIEAAPSTIAIVSRDVKGHPDVVSVDGQTYKVCQTEDQDSCINPRAAGLNFGVHELKYWPGRPASEIATPLPATPSDTSAL